MLSAIVGLALSLLKGTLLLVSFVANNTFPQPLTKEEEEEQLKRWKEGCDEARDILVERNLRLVAHIVKKFPCVEVEQEDLISIGTIGLIKGINTFDMDKGVRLATYAARCIENEILMHLRATKKNRLEVSLQDSIGTDKEGNEISLIDILGTDPDVVLDIVETKLEYRHLYKIIKELDEREMQVLHMRFGLMDGIRKTQKEIAKQLGISRSYVSRIEKKAISKILKELKVENCQ